jgi:hypothetical protein
MNSKKKPAPPARKTFRHGDLRRALLEAGINLAREGGPQAVVLREATRSAGVAPNAAYRRAVGTGYLKFALTERGLFRTAFLTPDLVEDDLDVAKTGESGLNPFQLLNSALDMLVSTGVLPQERRPGAEYLAWSAVHGLAFLVIDGPLNGASEKDIRALSERLLLMVENGL